MRGKILALAVLAMLLTGCTAKAEQLAQRYLQDDPDYQQYMELKEAGQLDSQGYYQDAKLEELQQQADTLAEGSLQVTFGENSKLSITYYYDEAMTQPIDPYNCRMDPGDKIYAAAAVSQEATTDLYRLDHYRIYAYDGNGQPLEQYETSLRTEGLIYEIPEDFSGSGISVMPVGAYAPHTLTVETYYLDEDGRKQTLHQVGTWTMNGQTVQGSSIQVDATKPYQMEYEMETENYFFVGSTPEPFHVGAATVTFPQTNPQEALAAYAVEVHPYLTLSLQCSQEAVIQRNEEAPVTRKKDKTLVLERLQYGDVITVETTGTCTIMAGDYQHVQATADPLQNGKIRYTLTIQEERNGDDAAALLETVQVRRVFTVTLEPRGSHGTCTYTLDGEPVSGTVEIREGQTLEAAYTLTDDRYEIADLGWWGNLWNEREQTVELPLTADRNGQSICGEDWVQLRQKGE